MKAFPMFIKTTGRRIVIAGGGEQAAQKARLIGRSDATLILAAPELDDELTALVDEGRAQHHPRLPKAQDFLGTPMAFVATGCPGADAAVHALAKEAGTLVNVVDRPTLCDLTTPSIVDRDPVVVAIGTEGAAPVLGRRIKTEVEQLLPPRLGVLAALAGRLRPAVARAIPRADRRGFWDWVFTAAPIAALRRGAEREAADLVKRAIEAGGAPTATRQGSITLVGAGPGARDLLTLRAVDRLQTADVIFYDRLSGEDALELARRDAERIYVGKTVGGNAWPQDRITNLIVAEAKQGRNVVRLKSGDPSIFGRATEEMEAAKAADIPVELIPGVTAASAAAASLGHSLTERGQTDTLVLATGACRAGDALPDWAQHVRPGTTLALYMAVGAADQISDVLQGQGAPGDTPVDVVVQASHQGERRLTLPLNGLAQGLAEGAVTGAAMILIRLPKSATLATVPRLIAAE